MLYKDAESAVCICCFSANQSGRGGEREGCVVGEVCVWSWRGVFIGVVPVVEGKLTSDRQNEDSNPQSPSPEANVLIHSTTPAGNYS